MPTGDPSDNPGLPPTPSCGDAGLGRLSFQLLGLAVLAWVLVMVLYFAPHSGSSRPLTIIQIGNGIDHLLWAFTGAAIAVGVLGRDTRSGRRALTGAAVFTAFLVFSFIYGCVVQQARHQERLRARELASPPASPVQSK